MEASSEYVVKVSFIGLANIGHATAANLVAAARAVAVPLPIASLVRDQLLAALAQGHGDADWGVLGALAARNAGLSRAASGETSSQGSGGNG